MYPGPKYKAKIKKKFQKTTEEKKVDLECEDHILHTAPKYIHKIQSSK